MAVRSTPLIRDRRSQPQTRSPLVTARARACPPLPAISDLVTLYLERRGVIQITNPRFQLPRTTPTTYDFLHSTLLRMIVAIRR